MITSFTEMLELPNFGHMTTSTALFESSEKTLVLDLMDIDYETYKVYLIITLF